MAVKKQCYQIKINGHIHLNWSEFIDEITTTFSNDGMTILKVVLPDQTALHGLLMRIRDLGLSLEEVKRIHPPNPSQEMEK